MVINMWIKNYKIHALFIFFIIITNVASNHFLASKEMMSDEIDRSIDLDRIIPDSFDEWHEVSVDKNLIVDVLPEVQQSLNKLYDKQLSRVYTNKDGYKIMLSVVYGHDQSNDSSQVHRPEICYAAQGFHIISNNKSILEYNGIALPISQLIASNSIRVEPITYWMVIGEKATYPGIDRKLLQFKYALNKITPDGYLIRVSSIDPSDHAFLIQKQFIQSMLSHVAPLRSSLLTGV